MHQTLLSAVSQLGCPNILIVGDYMLDVYIYGDALRISPEAPVPILKVRNRTHSCGGASSVAADVAALGAHPVCLGLIGQDANGRTLVELLSDIGADVSGLEQSTDRPTITKTRLIGLAQHRHQQQLLRMDDESMDPVSSQHCQQVLAQFAEKLAEADVVCLQDYNKGLLNPTFCQDVIHLARQADKPVLVDPAFITDYSKYRGATLITPNRQETAFTVGFEVETEGDIARAAQQLVATLKLDAAVITLDKQGAYLQSAEHTGIIPTRPRRVYDVTGAGDMVLAMLATAMGSGCGYETAVQLANVAGGIEVGKFGVATVTREEITSELLGQSKGLIGKVLALGDLQAQLDKHRQQGHSIVFTNGCFDVLHRGHVQYLAFCKAQGDVVVVGLNSDSSVTRIKGPARPVNEEQDRAAVLAALESVDFVTIFDAPDPLELIEIVEPDCLVKGQDWQDKGVVGADFVESRGGKVVLAPLVEGKSSTDVINKLKQMGKDA